MKFLLLLLIIFFFLSFFGDTHWTFDLLSHFRLHFFLAAFSLSLLALFLRRPYIFYPALILCFVILVFSGPYWSSSQHIKESSKSYNSLSLMTFNVWKDNENFQPTLAYIRKTHPDIVGLIEVDHSMDQALQSLRDLYPYYYSKPEEGRFGLALMSRHPFEVMDTSPYSFNEPVITVKLTTQSRSNPIHLVLLHPRPPINKAFTESRNDDFDTLSSWIQNLGDDPLIMMGDLNATRWSPSLSRLIKTNNLVGTQGIWSPGSWPSELGYFGIRIDHIFFKNFKGAPDLSVGPNLGSDHRPVNGKITWP